MIRKMISDDLLFVLIFMYPEGRSCPIIKYRQEDFMRMRMDSHLFPNSVTYK